MPFAVLCVVSYGLGLLSPTQVITAVPLDGNSWLACAEGAGNDPVWLLPA